VGLSLIKELEAGFVIDQIDTDSLCIFFFILDSCEGFSEMSVQNNLSGNK